LEKQTNEYDLMISIIEKFSAAALKTNQDEVVTIYAKLAKAVKESKQ
jgi:hypothetical protein